MPPGGAGERVRRFLRATLRLLSPLPAVSLFSSNIALAPMNKIAKILGLGLLFLCLSTLPGFANPHSRRSPTTAIDTGTVEKVNSADKSFKVEDSARHPGKKFTWDAQTLFKLSSIKSNAAALRPGMEVKVIYKMAGDIPMALRVYMTHSNQPFGH